MMDCYEQEVNGSNRYPGAHFFDVVLPDFKWCRGELEEQGGMRQSEARFE